MSASQPESRPQAHKAHAAIDHYKRAIDHIDAAKVRYQDAVRHHEKGEHATAHEVSKGASGHLGEAVAHAHEAERLAHPLGPAHQGPGA